MHMYAHTHTCEKNACTPLHTNVRTHVCTHTHTWTHTNTYTRHTCTHTHTHNAFNYTMKLIPQTRSHHFIPVHCKWNQWTHLRRTMFRTPMEQIVTILYLVLSPEMTPTHTATTTETRNTTVTPPACNQCLGIEEESLILLVQQGSGQERMSHTVLSVSKDMAGAHRCTPWHEYDTKHTCNMTPNMKVLSLRLLLLQIPLTSSQIPVVGRQTGSSLFDTRKREEQ